jgi:phage terminase small subunit
MPAQTRGDGPRLSPRQQRFIEEYLVDLNATRAAIRAGYARQSAARQGSRLLANARIRAAVDDAITLRSHRTGITQDQVLREYARLAFSDLRQVASWGPNGLTVIPSAALGDDAAAMLAEVHETRTAAGGTVRVKLHEKRGALDALARHLGLFNEAPGPTGLVVRNDIDLGGAEPGRAAEPVLPNLPEAEPAITVNSHTVKKDA